MQTVKLLCKNDAIQRVYIRLYQLSIRTLTTKPRNYQDKCGQCDSEDECCDDNVKVTVLGASGRVGKTLSLLLKTCPLIDHLCLFDIDKSVRGISVDISHIDTKCRVTNVCGMTNIEEALQDPEVVLIAAGYPISNCLYGKKLFKRNAPIVAGLAEACALYCPEACVILITNPINSLLPVAAEIYRAIICQIPSKRLFGLTSLDVIRANTFVAEVTRQDPNKVIVPVIGGTSPETIVPVISQTKPYCKIKQEETIALTECLKNAEANLSDCQNCGTPGSSSLTTAYAAFRFTSCLISALKGEKDIVECAYVRSNVIPELEYLASPLKLGPGGIEYNFGYPDLSEYEVNLMEAAAPILKSDIDLGKTYVRNFIKKNENNDSPASPLTCYFSSDDYLFNNRRCGINKRQERQYGTCIEDDYLKTNPQFMDSVLKRDDPIYRTYDVIDPEFEEAPKKFFTYTSRVKEGNGRSRHLKNEVETEKKESQSKWFQPKKNNKKNEKCREEEEEGNVLAASKCENFPMFLSSRISVPVPYVYDSIEYCEVKNPPLNGFSVAIYFLCFIVMYLFMSIRYF